MHLSGPVSGLCWIMSYFSRTTLSDTVHLLWIFFRPDTYFLSFSCAVSSHFTRTLCTTWWYLPGFKLRPHWYKNTISCQSNWVIFSIFIDATKLIVTNYICATGCYTLVSFKWFNKKIHSSENGQVKGLEWKISQTPKKNFKGAFRRPWELLMRSTLNDFKKVCFLGSKI